MNCYLHSFNFTKIIIYNIINMELNKVQLAYNEQRKNIIERILEAINNNTNTIAIHRNSNCDHFDIMFILSGLQSNKLINVTHNNKEENMYIVRWTNPNSILNYLKRPITYNKQFLYI